MGTFTTYHSLSGLIPTTAMTVPLGTIPRLPKGPPGPVRTLSGSRVINAGAPEAGAAGVILRGRSGVRSVRHVTRIDDGSVCLVYPGGPIAGE